MMSSNTVACHLHSLPVDGLVALLSASVSLADLYAFIRASPLLYEVFLKSKTAILLEICSRDEGPVIRDYVAFSLTAPLDWYTEAYRSEALEAVQRYQGLPPGRNATMGITEDQVIAIIQFQRTVQFFLNLYAATRLAVLEAIRGQPAAAAIAAPLSREEHQRVSQALVRHQVFTRIHPEPDRRHSADAPIRSGFFGLFASWEMEQISTAHAFVFSVHRAYAACTPRPERRLYTHKAVPVFEGEDEYLHNVIDMGMLRHKILSAAAFDSGLMQKMRVYLQGEADKPVKTRCLFNVLTAGEHFPKTKLLEPLPDGAPHSFLVRQEKQKEAIKVRDALYLREDARAPLVACTSTGEPPFGWVDALQGLDCHRWGEDLPRCAPNGTTVRRQMDVLENVARWRWLGFVFWDKGRIELAKASEGQFKTGWLTEVWD
ncbi:subtilase [Apiospora rasikravindrae]|uniref:Subtilase n=1 Tax=Apiospora rasikravindrae TaxID=990691 RepID=A0ABR1THD8_9PEZI